VSTDASAAEQGAELARLLPLVEAILLRLFGGADLALVRRVAEVELIHLTGPHPDLVFTPEPADPAWIDDLYRTGVGVVCGGQVVPVYPLLLPVTDAMLVAVPGLADPANTVPRLPADWRCRDDRLVPE